MQPSHAASASKAALSAALDKHSASYDLFSATDLALDKALVVVLAHSSASAAAIFAIIVSAMSVGNVDGRLIRPSLISSILKFFSPGVRLSLALIIRIVLRIALSAAVLASAAVLIAASWSAVAAFMAVLPQSSTSSMELNFVVAMALAATAASFAEPFALVLRSLIVLVVTLGSCSGCDECTAETENRFRSFSTITEKRRKQFPLSTYFARN
jgi:hypothetical protein